MSNGEPAAESLNVLIVEDDDDARANLQDILELRDHQVSTRQTFAEAFAIGNLNVFDVIILDRKLPDGMVEERLPEFREVAPKTDLIVITGYADTRASIAALREGVTDYIIKPIDPEALLRSLDHIARRRDVERALAKEHEFNEMVLETAEAIILVLDRKGRITRFNDYLAELTEHSLDEVENHDWFDTFIPESEREYVRRVFEQTLSEKGSRGILNSIVTKSGVKKEIRWSNNVIFDRSGNVTGILAVGLDVSDLMEAERKARRSDRLATIGQTMAGMAHESRNALQRIRNSVELLEDELGSDHEALRYVEKIGRASNDLQDLLEEVRSYAAPIKLDRDRVCISSVWRGAWETLEHKRSRATLTEQTDQAELPTISVDPRRMEQVFRNLFENAFDACGEDVEVCIRFGQTDKGLEIRVRDNGPGMPAEVRDHIFDAFFTTKATGTGLGMAIVHRIVEAHGGDIQVVEVPSGSEFLICLPIQDG